MEKELYPKIYFYRRLVQAKLFIDTHYDAPINLDAIAGEAFFSKFHFIRSFKKIYRQTPHQYLSFVRLEKAKALLQTDVPIASVCYGCGFESVGSFTTLFKKTTGLTPSEYRGQQRRLAADRQLMPLKYIPACFASKNGWTQKSNF